MAGRTAKSQIPRDVQAFGDALSAVRPVQISIPGTRPLLVGVPPDEKQVRPSDDEEDFPNLRRKHQYRFGLANGPLDLSVQLFKNTRGHWRLFAFCRHKSVFSLNLTLAQQEKHVLSLQQRLKLTNYAMSPEERFQIAARIAERLRGLGLNVTEDRDIIFPDFDTRSGKFIGSTAAAFLRNFVVTAVVKGHYMENKGYELPGFDVRISPPGQVSGFDPDDVEDARQRALADVVRRPGQPAFREALLRAYGGRCAVTGCDFPGTLEAAHITPHLGTQTDHVENGLLLRADIHMLFDRGLLAVDAKTMKVRLAAALKGTVYQALEGKVLATPKTGNAPPSRQALDKHRRKAGL